MVLRLRVAQDESPSHQLLTHVFKQKTKSFSHPPGHILAKTKCSSENKALTQAPKFLRMRCARTWKYTEGGDKKAKARLVILEYQHPELNKRTDSSTNTWKDVTSIVTAGLRFAQTSGPFG